MASYLKDVRKAPKPSGFSRDKSNLDEWSAIASERSRDAPRAGGTMSLRDNGGQPQLRSTSAPPPGFGADPYARAKADLNHDGSNYMKQVRRSTR
ncbi:hypothetical protein [Bradyrhizobium sp. STM 3843]|uniref:hypothetical protein n=1 Tax=Bradyrhizobium sp. STM 3843 TaxID=551947 RepID=UPI0011127BBF|nr:hypothetical protein [Bradyrhizobium sp. STM 3843]